MFQDTHLTKVPMSNIVRNKAVVPLTAALISVITILIYLPALRNGFVNWDDFIYVAGDLNIRSLNINLLKYLLTFEAFPPLTTLSFAINYAISGLNPTGYHLTNILIHALNTFLIFILTIRLMEYGSLRSSLNHLDPSTLMVASITAFLFGIHPLNVEAATWVMGRGHLQSSLFFLLSIYFYLKYISENNRQFVFYCLSIIAFIISLICKPISVTLPLVLVIIDFFLLGRLKTAKGNMRAAVLIDKAPFFLLSLVGGFLAVNARSTLIESTEPLEIHSFFVAIRATLFPVRKFLFPVNIAPYYPYPREIELFRFEYIGSLLFTIAITLFCILYYKKSRLFLATWLFYLITLFPTLIPLLGVYRGMYVEADRYAYLPTIGIFMLTGLGVASIYKRCSSKKPRFILTVFFIIMTGILINNTISQIGFWRNSVTLWTHEITVLPDVKDIPYFNRGTAYYYLGDYQRALNDFNQAIQDNPMFFETYYNRGMTYGKVRYFQKAIEDYNKAIELNPKCAKAYTNRGIIFKILGRYEQAIEDLKKAIDIDPRQEYAYNSLGFIYLDLGNKERAQRYLKRAADMGVKEAQEYLRRSGPALQLYKK